MEGLSALIVAGVGLEALIQILRNLWDADTRGDWNLTKILVVVVALVVAYLGDVDMLAGSGLDFGVDALGPIMSGLAMGRAANWVHDLYAKTKGM